jgi:hypothetical protein
LWMKIIDSVLSFA